MIEYCSVGTCSNREYNLGFCHAHYTRLKRYGDPTAGGPSRRRKGSFFTTCSVPGCEMPHASHGFCGKHAYRWRVHGDPLGGGTPKGAAVQWLHEHSGYPSDECLTWPFSRNHEGYGNLKYKGASSAHRAMCIVVHGEPPAKNMDAAHSCGKGHLGCVNPRHLSWKTRSANQWDRVAHGTSIRGEVHRSAQLTEDDVREIRALKGKALQKQIATQFGISPSLVSLIHSRKVWGWLDDACATAGNAHDQ